MMKSFQVFILVILLSIVSKGHSLIILEDVMTPEERKTTGVATLTANQKEALEAWLNANFSLKTPEQKQAEKVLYLSENIDSGRKIRLSNGALYEIAPSDINKSAFWITPFPIRVVPTEDPSYPYKLVNINTGSSINARLAAPVKEPTPTSRNK